MKVSSMETRRKEKQQAEEKFQEEVRLFEVMRRVNRERVSSESFPSGTSVPADIITPRLLKWMESQVRMMVADAKMSKCACCQKTAAVMIGNLLNAMSSYNPGLEEEVYRIFYGDNNAS